MIINSSRPSRNFSEEPTQALQEETKKVEKTSKKEKVLPMVEEKLNEEKEETIVSSEK